MKTKLGVTAVAAVVLLAGCASSDSGSDAATGSSSSTSSTSSTASSPTTANVDCSDPDLSQAEWTANCGPDATGGGAAPATSPTYDHPADMMDKATAKLPYLVCEDEVPQRDILGALGLSCTGRNGESVTFDVYKTNADLLSGTETSESINTGSMYYAGETWTFSAEEDRTLEDLQRVLDPKNAPDVTPLTTSQAKREYQRMVKPLNDSLGELDYIGEYAEVDEYQAACTTIDDAHDTFAAELEFAAWPEAVAGKIPALVTDVKSDREHWKDCSEATSVDDANTALDSLSTDQGPANAVRSALGLEDA